MDAVTANDRITRGTPRSRALFDLRFAEDDVLARHRIELLELELVRLGPRVLLRDVEKAGIGAADELDQNGAGFRHGGSRGFGSSAVSKIARGRPLSRRARAGRPRRDGAPAGRSPAERSARSRKAADRRAGARRASGRWPGSSAAPDKTAAIPTRRARRARAAPAKPRALLGRSRRPAAARAAARTHRRRDRSCTG